jgi:hypothetical protein
MALDIDKAVIMRGAGDGHNGKYITVTKPGYRVTSGQPAVEIHTTGVVQIEGKAIADLVEALLFVGFGQTREEWEAGHGSST